VHDAAITAWGIKREYTGPPADHAHPLHGEPRAVQRSDPPQLQRRGPAPGAGVVELITEESAAPGERHHHLRWFIGEIAI
jgi:hypothetical protein